MDAIALICNFVAKLNNMKILIIEDELELATAIANYLNCEKYICEVAHNYNSAIEKVDLYNYECIILDLNLPDGSGFDIIKLLKMKRSESGIIIISARNALNDKIEGLDLGADDYLSKPFSLSELNARLRSVIRRRHFNGQVEYSYNEIKIQPDVRKVFIAEIQLELTRKEYDLLIFLITNQCRVLSKETIIEHLWGDYMGIEADSYNALYTHMGNLRKKMQDAGCKDYIDTVYAVGYKFNLSKS